MAKHIHIHFGRTISHDKKSEDSEPYAKPEGKQWVIVLGNGKLFMDSRGVCKYASKDEADRAIAKMKSRDKIKK